eukprot:m.227579 g.227579  ORF g.227579 m.227579 type:complete len:95 (+) comp17045_c4_seq2:274-558(+)
MLRQSYDVVVVGAGIMGLHTAYQLARRDNKLRIALLEKANSLGQGSSGFSTALLRCVYTFDEMIHAACDGLVVHKNWAEYTQLESPAAKFTAVR